MWFVYLVDVAKYSVSYVLDVFCCCMASSVCFNSPSLLAGNLSQNVFANGAALRYNSTTVVVSTLAQFSSLSGVNPLLRAI